MNKRALVYLGLASATLAGAYLYVEPLSQQAVSEPAQPDSNAAMALQSLAVVDGQLTTGPLSASVRQGQRIQFLVHSDALDSLIVEGLDTRVSLPANETTLVTLEASEPGHHAIQLDLAGTTLGTIAVTPH